MRKMLMVSALAMFTLSPAYASCYDSALNGYMHNIKDELKAVANEVKAGNNNEAIQHTDALIAIFHKARMELPYQFTQQDLKGAELAAQTESYHKLVDDTIGVLNDLEAALKANDSAQVRHFLAAMSQQRKAGHRAFKQNC